MHIFLVVNTGSTDVLDTLRGVAGKLRDAGHTVAPRLTFEAGDARRLAREAAEAGADLLVAGGGDGTVNEAVNGLFDWIGAWDGDTGGQTPPLPRLGVIPLGTGNDLAGALELPMDPEEAVAVALAGTPLPVDVAEVNGRRFLNVSSGGLGAEATEEASDGSKRVLGSLAYVVSGVRKYVQMDLPSARFVADGETVHEGPFAVFAVGNSRRTGGGNWLTPHADLSDGLLDLLVVREVTRVDFLTLAPQLRAGTHLDHPAVLYRRVRALRVESDQELHVNADGEPMRGLCFDYRLSPHRLELMTPGPLGEDGEKDTVGEKDGLEVG